MVKVDNKNIEYLENFGHKGISYQEFRKEFPWYTNLQIEDRIIPEIHLIPTHCYMLHIKVLLLKILVVIVPLLVSVAYFTLAERKLIASIQRRRGPNVVGYIGLLQPLADGLKLFVKESIFPSNANTFLFVLAPLLTFFLSLIGWAVIPYGPGQVISDINLGILYLLAISSLGVYGIMTSGWASNSKYAFLGALRSAAQIVSYEVSIGFTIASILLCVGSFNLSEIVCAQEEIWYIFPHLPIFGIFLVSALAETNRHPFDLPEAEAELVSGYNVEYSAIGFALFFLGEYANILLISALTAILFLGGWLPIVSFLSFIPGSIWFGVKICIFVAFFIVTRATLPRYRYDQLITLGWKVFLPLSLAWLAWTIGVLLSFNALPV
jgi:NADH-quinone oxidoreductase subunit H